jgi:hypothetical protein
MKVKISTAKQNNWIELESEGAIEEIQNASESLKNSMVDSVETISGIIVRRA